MSRTRICLPLLLLLAVPGLGTAQDSAAPPGYFPIEDLGILPEESINLEINLTGPMMKLIALATDDDEPELAQLVENLDSIRVRGSNLEGVHRDEVRTAMRGASERLRRAGWKTMVRLEESDESTYVFYREQDGNVLGLTVLSLEDEEAMLINLVGPIDPVQLGQLARGLDLPQLERAVPEETP